MGEGLGEISEGFSGGPDPLRVQANVISVGERLLQDEPRFFQPAGFRETLHQPERAGAEAALGRREAVVRGIFSVPVDEAVAGQLPLETLQGREPAGIGWADELDQRHQQQRRVHGLAAVVLDEALSPGIPTLLHHLLVDGVPLLYPAIHISRQAPLSGHAHRPLQRHPAHHPRGDEVPRLAPDLPHSGVFHAPAGAQPVQDLFDLLPEVVV